MTCELLRTEQNGIEFYTIASSGESGISQSGLAILCGVHQTTIAKLEKTLMNSEASESLKAFSDERFTLMKADTEAIVDGEAAGNLRIYRAEFCIAVIKHYADKGRKEAVYSLMKFAEMGFNAWIQSVTGWRSPSEVAEVRAEVAEIRAEVAEVKADVAEFKSDISEIKALVQSVVDDRTSPSPRPLFSEEEIRRQAKRELHFLTIPGTVTNENAAFIRELFGDAAPEESGSGMNSMGGVLGSINLKPKPAALSKGTLEMMVKPKASIAPLTDGGDFFR